MYIIEIKENEENGYSPIQTWDKETPPEGYAIISEEQRALFYSTTPAGFVNITVKEEDGVKVVDTIEINEKALKAYQANMPSVVNIIKKIKIDEIAQDCERYINSGTEVKYDDGVSEHFTYAIVDQSNISEMFNAVMSGATEFPYHADGEVCRVYTKEQIIKIYSELFMFKTEATTYHNSLKAQVKSMINEDEIKAVKYHETVLTGEYLENYNKMMEVANTQLATILSKI